MITSSAFLNIPWRSLRLLSKRSASSVQLLAAEVQRIHLLRASVNRTRMRLHCRPRTFAGSGVAHSGILKNRKGRHSHAQSNSRDGQRGVLPISSGRGCGPDPVVVHTLAGTRAHALLGAHASAGNVTYRSAY